MFRRIQKKREIEQDPEVYNKIFIVLTLCLPLLPDYCDMGSLYQDTRMPYFLTGPKAKLITC